MCATPTVRVPPHVVGYLLFFEHIATAKVEMGLEPENRGDKDLRVMYVNQLCRLAHQLSQEKLTILRALSGVRFKEDE